VTAEAQILGFVDLSPAPGPQLTEETVVRDDLDVHFALTTIE